MADTGEYNQKIEIYSQSTTSNQFGGGTAVNNLYWSTNAKTFILESSRTLEANQQNLRMVVEFEVRARVDKEIYDDMLVKWRGQWFVIQGYKPDVVYKKSVKFRAIVMNSGDLMSGTNETT